MDVRRFLADTLHNTAMNAEFSMKIRFYFDYSDYRSYLMMHTIAAMNDLPLSVHWIAVDAYSLRALSGSESHDNAQNEREFQKREALRFCQREGLDFVWQSERLHNGTALKAGVWLMQHDSRAFVPFSRKVLEMMWGLGKNVDASAIRAILTDLEIDSDAIFRTSSDRDGFQYQDACLQEALSDGVFDVPAIVIGNEIVCHFDMASEIRRLAILEWLQSLPQEAVYMAYTRELMALNNETFKRHIAALVRKNDVRQADIIPLDASVVQIQHTLSVPDANWHLSRLPARGEFLCHICAMPAPGTDAEKLASMLADTAEGAINICPVSNLAFDDASEIEAIAGNGLTPRLFYAAVQYRGTASLLYIRIDSGGAPHVEFTAKDADHAMLWESSRGWAIAALGVTASRDLNMARLAAHRGAHVIVRLDGGDTSPTAEAFGCLAAAWVLDIQSLSVVDAEAHRLSLRPGADFVLNPSYRIADVPGWTPPPPRTLLLCDKSLTFGELSAHADIELASRGMNLLVTTSQQASELSNTRVFERIRIAENQISLMPLYSEQIFVSELLSHRMLEVFNRASHDSVPVAVNYWSALEFEMLEVLRPVLAATVTMYHIPVVLVVGNQIVEIWLPSAQGVAYLVEKDDDCYTIDLSDLIQTGDCIQKMLSIIGVNETDFLGRLYRIESVYKK